MRYYIIDAFADRLFRGNQAGVCLLDEWLPDGLMQDIAAENNLPETAFVVKRDGYYDLRWFSPAIEVDLCGHATLASAFVVANFLDTGVSQMDFHTKSGVLTVMIKDGLLEMDFPSREPVKIGMTPQMQAAVGAPVLEAYLSRDLLLLLDNEERVKNLCPDMSLVERLPEGMGLIVTAKGDSADFVSRFFCPKVGVSEDPVTGSSHATLIPFWAKRLEKSIMIARQLSKRGGTLYCENCGERVKISGRATLYLQGELFINI